MTQRLFISTNRLAKEWNLGALRTGVQPARWRAWRLGVAVDDVIGHVVSRCPREERRPIVGRQALPFLRHAVSVKASSHRLTRHSQHCFVVSVGGGVNWALHCTITAARLLVLRTPYR